MELYEQTAYKGYHINIYYENKNADRKAFGMA